MQAQGSPGDFRLECDALVAEIYAHNGHDGFSESVQELFDCLGETAELIDSWARRTLDGVALLDHCCEIEERLRSDPSVPDDAENSQTRAALLSIVARVRTAIAPESQGRRSFYVYVHKDAAGRIFYVGKGTRGRAWSKDRHSLWHKYVEERLHGVYSVEIISRDLLESQAERQESAMIEELGERLVNWVNPGRGFDYPAIALFHKLRDANRALVAEAKAVEATSLEEAAAMYRRAMSAMHEYATMTLERGFVADLMGNEYHADEAVILDRLTLCLERLGRGAEIVSEASAYAALYPQSQDRGARERVRRRVDRALAGKLRRQA